MDEKTGNLFTDCAVNLLDDTGKTIRAGSFDGLEAHVRASLPEGKEQATFTVQVVGAFAIAADMADWGFDLEERFLFARPVAGKVSAKAAADLVLYCGVPTRPVAGFRRRLARRRPRASRPSARSPSGTSAPPTGCRARRAAAPCWRCPSAWTEVRRPTRAERAGLPGRPARRVPVGAQVSSVRRMPSRMSMWAFRSAWTSAQAGRRGAPARPGPRRGAGRPAGRPGRRAGRSRRSRPGTISSGRPPMSLPTTGTPAARDSSAAMGAFSYHREGITVQQGPGQHRAQIVDPQRPQRLGRLQLEQGQAGLQVAQAGPVAGDQQARRRLGDGARRRGRAPRWPGLPAGSAAPSPARCGRSRPPRRGRAPAGSRSGCQKSRSTKLGRWRSRSAGKPHAAYLSRVEAAGAEEGAHGGRVQVRASAGSPSPPPPAARPPATP